MRWWRWVGQMPGGGKRGEDVSHSPSRTCSWVLCEISAATQESQEKPGGGKKRAQESPGGGCFLQLSEITLRSRRGPHWEMPLPMLGYLCNEKGPSSRSPSCRKTYRSLKQHQCRWERCALLPPRPWEDGRILVVASWQWMVTTAAGAAVPAPLPAPPLAIWGGRGGGHIWLSRALPFSFPQGALGAPHPSLCTHVQGNII